MYNQLVACTADVMSNDTHCCLPPLHPATAPGPNQPRYAPPPQMPPANTPLDHRLIACT